MKKVSFGLMMAVGVLAMTAGAARADKPAAEKPAETAHTTKPAMAAENTTAKNGKPTGEAAASNKSATRPGKMMCEEFLTLDEVMKPKVLYWAEGFTKKGKPEDAVFDVESTERLVPTLVEVCQKEPKASFMKKVKAESKKTQ